MIGWCWWARGSDPCLGTVTYVEGSLQVSVRGNGKGLIRNWISTVHSESSFVVGWSRVCDITGGKV